MTKLSYDVKVQSILSYTFSESFVIVNIFCFQKLTETKTAISFHQFKTPNRKYMAPFKSTLKKVSQTNQISNETIQSEIINIKYQWL